MLSRICISFIKYLVGRSVGWYTNNSTYNIDVVVVVRLELLLHIIMYFNTSQLVELALVKLLVCNYKAKKEKIAFNGMLSHSFCDLLFYYFRIHSSGVIRIRVSVFNR